VGFPYPAFGDMQMRCSSLPVYELRVMIRGDCLLYTCTIGHRLQDGWNCHRESPASKSGHPMRMSAEPITLTFADLRLSCSCQRCRRQKIKCSGSQPCNTCSRRKQSCKFDDRDQKILVTRGYGKHFFVLPTEIITRGIQIHRGSSEKDCLARTWRE
jgi:hypothetical protein